MSDGAVEFDALEPGRSGTLRELRSAPPPLSLLDARVAAAAEASAVVCF